MMVTKVISMKTIVNAKRRYDRRMVVKTHNLVGAHEIAQRLNRAHSTIVHGWVRRDINFPPPAVVLQAGKFWDWSQVERWAKETGRL